MCIYGISVGKWHLGLTPDSKPIQRGFDETLGFDIISRYLPYGYPSAACTFPDFFDRYLWANIRYEVSKDNGPFFAPEGYLTDYLANEAAKAIHINKDHPFFMYVAFTSMHTPLEALPSDYKAVEALETIHGYAKDEPRMSHCQKVYGAMILALDRAVGTILKAIDAAGVAEDTIVIFTNDNGAPLIFPNLNTPYRGGKANLFDGGVRVPLLVRWPAMGKGGAGERMEESSSEAGLHALLEDQQRDVGIEVESMVSHLDLFPSIMEAAGAVSPGEKPLDGSSLLPLMRACADAAHTVGTGHGKCTVGGGHNELFWRSGHYMALRKGKWKLQVSGRPQKMWLYDMEVDPGEKNNLAGESEYQEKLHEMIMLLHAENSTHSEPLWPALSETPLLIDKLFHDHYVPGDEYIYWPN